VYEANNFHAVLCPSHEILAIPLLTVVCTFVFGRRISSQMYRKLSSEAARLEQEELDIRCLQLLRATIHNEERKLPEDWEENAADNKK